MAKQSEEFIAGWQAAREQYQATGGVQPYPPGHYEVDEPAPEAPKKGKKE